MRYRNSLSINFWNMLLQVKETRLKICCFLKKLEQSMFPQKLRNFIAHLFSSSSNNEKCAILSLVPNSYNKTEIMKLFNCLRYLVDKAKKASYFQQINRSNFTKSKLDCEKAQHFIEFLFSLDAI